MTNILVVDDQKAQRKNLAFYLKSQGYDVDTAESGEEAQVKIGSGAFDLVICDYKLGKMDGLELMKLIQKSHPSLDFVVMTAFGSIPLAVDFIKDGAADFIAKPFEYSQILDAVKKILRKQIAKSEPDENNDLKMVVHSQKMKDIIELANKAAGSDVNVLIEGEIGTGKELLARIIHQQSRRGNGQFSVIECSSDSPETLDREIFGVVDGEIGALARSDCGTVFIRNIEQLNLQLQAKLLRFMRDGIFSPAESSSLKKSDVRIIASASRNIKHQVQAGMFREDLYYLLNVMPLYMPPLRTRDGEILPLVKHFLTKYRSKGQRNITNIAPEVISWMTTYDWPGNVQELENVISRACALANNETLDESLIFTLPQDRPRDEKDHGYLNITLKDNQKTLILKALKQNSNNFSRTANQLGISRTTLWRRLKKFKIDGIPVEQD
jgi:DNA-binding NtrC family response regulator